VVCHGVPSATDVLRGGDIVNFDITPERNGCIADSSKTYRVGEVSTSARRLVQITYEAMWKGIEAVRPRARLGEAGPAIGCLHMGRAMDFDIELEVSKREQADSGSAGSDGSDSNFGHKKQGCHGLSENG
jgi:methionine aminopeptidase